MDKEILELLQNINKRLDILENSQEEIKLELSKLSNVTEDITSSNKELSDKVNEVNGVAMINCYDIAELKAIVNKTSMKINELSNTSNIDKKFSDIETEVKFMKSCIGELSIDMKYLKKRR